MNKNTGTVHHLCTTGRCGTKHPCVAAMRSLTPPNGNISYLGGCWRSVTFVKMTFIEQDAAFVSFVVPKLRVTQQSKRRLYLELLLEPGSKPWYVVVVVIFLLKKTNVKRLEFSRMYTRMTLSHQYFIASSLSALASASESAPSPTEPSRDRSFRQDFKIKSQISWQRYLQFPKSYQINCIVYVVMLHQLCLKLSYFLGQNLV